MINYHSRILDLEDKEIVYNLMQKCNDYFEMLNGYSVTLEDVENIYSELPNTHNYQDKFLIGVFSENKDLIGIVDFLRDYPFRDSWCLGLMLLDPKFRSQGLGKKVYDDLEEWAVDLGAKVIRIGVLDQNKQAIKFWSILGFKEIETKEIKYGNFISNVIVMIRKPIDT